VLREGASALYGSDAIAGVINFITKKNYQGAEIQGNFDQPQQAGGGRARQISAFGHGDLASDGYNFMITGSYSKATGAARDAAGVFRPWVLIPRGRPQYEQSGILAWDCLGCQR
jgi:iron complex outermembrane recepter protein